MYMPKTYGSMAIKSEVTFGIGIVSLRAKVNAALTHASAAIGNGLRLRLWTCALGTKFAG